MSSTAGTGVDPVIATILACEAGFWLTILLGMLLRYALRLRRASSIVLALVPLIDVVLVVAVAIDVHRGAEISAAHLLAGIYLGVTVVFGKSAVRWADSWFAHWFGGGPRPPKRADQGSEGIRAEMKSFGKWLIAAAIAIVVCFGLSVTVANPEQATALRGVMDPLEIITVLWFVTGPAWLFVFRKEAKR